jgi:hypothetical protein
MQKAKRTTKCLIISLLSITAGLAVATTPVRAQSPPSEEWLKAHEEMDDSDTVKIRCPYRGPECLPPGTCKKSRQNDLQEKKNQACGKPRACGLPKPPKDPQKVQDSEKVNCGEFEDFIRNGQDCMDRRTDVMDTCFRGGDPRHEDELPKVERNVNECKQALAFAKGQNICK